MSIFDIFRIFVVFVEGNAGVEVALDGHLRHLAWLNCVHVFCLLCTACYRFDFEFEE